MWIVRLSDNIDKMIRILLIILLTVLFLNVLVTAILRFIFEYSFIASYDYSRIMFLWVVFLGASVVYKQRAHSKLVFFYDRIKGNFKYGLDLIMNLLLILFLFVLVIAGTQLTFSASVQSLPASGISLSWLYASIVFGALIMLVHGLAFLYKDNLAYFISNQDITDGKE